MSRTSNSIKMVMASTANQIVAVLCGFILPPLLINHLGSEINGLLSAVKQMMAYFGIVCLGLGSAAQVALYKPLADGDWKKINAILASTKHFFAQSGLVFAILILVSSFAFPFLFKSDVPFIDIFLIIIITGVGSISEYVVVAKYKVFLAANQKNYINSKITTEGIALNTFISILLIYCGCSAVIIQIGATIVYIIRLLLTIRYVKRHYPQISFNSEQRDDTALKDRWTAFSYQVSGIVISLTPAIVIGILCSLSDVSVYSIYFMLFSALMMIAGIFSAGLSAPFGDMFVRGETESVNAAFQGYEFVYTTIMYVCFSCAVVLLPSFISSYIHNADGVNYVLPVFSLLMCFNYITQCLRTPFKTILEAKGLFRENYKLNIAEALLFVLASFLFVYLWGLNGIAIAGIVTALPRSIKYLTDCCALLTGRNKKSRFIVKQMMNVLCSMALFFLFSEYLNSDNLIDWLISAIPYALCLSMVTLLFNIIIDFPSFLVVRKRLFMH